jgi:hypothetical protein
MEFRSSFTSEVDPLEDRHFLFDNHPNIREKPIPENVAFPPPERLQTAPANLEQWEDDYDGLFTSQDLVMLPRFTKTAPVISHPDPATSKNAFPSLAWPIRLQNQRLNDLLKYINGEGNGHIKHAWGPKRETQGESESGSVFEKEINEINRLLGNIFFVFDCRYC